MAFIPDDLVNKLHELSPKAALLFVHYCKWRNSVTGQTWPSLSTIAKEMAIPKSSACELRKQLIDRGWLELISGDTVRVVGNFELPEKAESGSEKSGNAPRTSFDIAESHSEKSNGEAQELHGKAESPVRKSRTPFGKVEPHSEKSNGKNGDRSEKSNEPFGKVESHNRKYQPMVPAHKETHVESADSTAGLVEAIFSYWQERLDHPNTKLTPERRRRVEARLRDKYTVEQIKQGIDGCASSPFNRGENDRGRPFDDLELICRNGSKLESFIALVTPRNGNGHHINGTASSKNRFCGKCEGGWLPLLAEQTEARRCPCVAKKEIAA